MVVEKLMSGTPPFLPDLVVINTTPFAALEPYNAAEVASFRTFMDSISSGFKLAMLPS
ncbi:hypothetical protein D3C78_1830040 [compost metagenome]